MFFPCFSPRSRARGARRIASVVTALALCLWLPAPSPAQVVPNDPLMSIQGDPATYQWGPYALDLPAAWAYNKGRAYVGVVDQGLDPTHPDLRPYAFYSFDGTTCSYDGAYRGGNFRHHRSHFPHPLPATESCDVNEELSPLGTRGHGTHVSGLVAATTDNGFGVAGTCWHCPILMGKTAGADNFLLGMLANNLELLLDHGVQVLNFSLGFTQYSCQPLAGNGSELPRLCAALDLAEARDVVIVASPGNDLLDIEFPANDSRVISAGGLEPDGDFWDERDDGGCPPPPAGGAPLGECGSNYQVTAGAAQQDVLAPAKSVLSTFYPGTDQNVTYGCRDSLLPRFVGWGPCTGTSMSSPIIAGVTGLIRSVNPLLPKTAVRTLLVDHADGGGGNDPQRGFGVPDAGASVEAALGHADGSILPNRLTPMFRLYAASAGRHLMTTVPQVAAARLATMDGPFVSDGPAVPGYDAFPGIDCSGGCPGKEPSAPFYVLTGDRDPGLGQNALVPLYRLTQDEPVAGDPATQVERRTAYATTVTDIDLLLEPAAGRRYFVDGIEGYLLDTCDGACQSAGGVAIHLRHDPVAGDFLLLTAGELTSHPAYGPPPWDLTEILGYGFATTDGDGDQLIDGFEALVGSDPADADTDCDGVSDGVEVTVFPYGDPLDGSCAADLSTKVQTAVQPGGVLVETVVFNAGPGAGLDARLGVVFSSPSLFALAPLPPGSDCASVPPGPHAGHALAFACDVGDLGVGAFALHSWTIQAGFGADVTVSVNGQSAVADPQPKNNQVEAVVVSNAGT